MSDLNTQETEINEERHVWIHFYCAFTAPHVVFEDEKWYNLAQAIQTCETNICSFCNKPGSSISCIAKKCDDSFHYRCAIENGLLDSGKPSLYASFKCPIHLNAGLNRKELQQKENELKHRRNFLYNTKTGKRLKSFDKRWDLLFSEANTYIPQVTIISDSKQN